MKIEIKLKMARGEIMTQIRDYKLEINRIRN